MHPSTDWHGVSRTDLARWDLLDRVLRERCIDGVLADRALPEPEQLTALRVEWERQHNLASPEQVQAWMELHGLDDEAIDRMAARSWQWLLWCQERWGSELQTIFLKRKPELDQVTYSLLRLRNGELASELYLQIKEGEASFADLAQEFSEGPEKQAGGLVGPMPLTQPHPGLAKLLQVSQPGQLWPPKALEGWWVIVRLETLHGAMLDAAMQERLLLDEGERAIAQLLQQRTVLGQEGDRRR
jgi:parvulin-like peptidyl-prolyl isomerase